MRYELSDAEWTGIKPMLCNASKGRGEPTGERDRRGWRRRFRGVEHMGSMVLAQLKDIQLSEQIERIGSSNISGSGESRGERLGELRIHLPRVLVDPGSW